MALPAHLIHPDEQKLFTPMAVISAALWLAAICAVFLYGPFMVLGWLLVHGLFIAHIRGNALRVGPDQLPHLHAMVVKGAEQLNLPKVPEVYVMQSAGILNAFATQYLSRSFVVLYGEIVDQCKTEKQIEFVLGHELGHLAAGHLKWNLLLAPARFIPWLGTAYSRGRELTCDRVGHFLCGDLEQSKRALTVLACGGQSAQQANVAAYAAQSAEGGTFLGSMVEVASDYPFLSTRVSELDNAAQPGSRTPVPRNILGLLLAPFLGRLGTPQGLVSALVTVYLVGIMAAIAIPNFIKFKERAAAAERARADVSSGATP